MNENCLLVKCAKQLALKIAEKEGEPEVKSYTRDYGAIAKIRHSRTNYDDLLEELSENSPLLSLDCFQQGICTFNDPDGVDECPNKREAYFIIRNAADELATKMLSQY